MPRGEHYYRYIVDGKGNDTNVIRVQNRPRDQINDFRNFFWFFYHLNFWGRFWKRITLLSKSETINQKEKTAKDDHGRLNNIIRLAIKMTSLGRNNYIIFKELVKLILKHSMLLKWMVRLVLSQTVNTDSQGYKSDRSSLE